MKHQQAAQLIFEAMRAGRPMPAALSHQLSRDDIYGVQFTLLARLIEGGEEQVGYKVGLTAKAMQEQQNFHEPCLGHLFASGHLLSPARAAFDDLLSPGFENELCVRLKSDLRGPGVDFAAAAGAIEAVAPAIEIVEKRGIPLDDLPLGLSVNAQQRYFVTGDFQPYTDNLDLAAVEVTVTVNGVEQERALGKEVLGHPINSVAWLANKLVDFGRDLKAGEVIMTGSFTKQYPIARGDRLDIAFSGLGAATIEFG